MIKVCYPPGCYGNYVTRSIYNYTNLRIGKFKNFKFDERGSSHGQNVESESKIKYGHLDSNRILFEDNDSTITILPCIDHMLDYYNNQFDKYAKKALVECIVEQLSITEIKQKLQQGWSYSDNFDNQTPVWILREFFSFWIVDCLINGYSIDKYKNVNSKISITTQDIFLNFLPTLTSICNVLHLEINIDKELIIKNHTNFLNLQKYHNSQLKCQQWVTDIILGTTSSTPCQTIFDESYVQYLLRESGFELQCDGLNIFPITSTDMKKLIYKK
jgi:hypothetical protein